MGAKAHVRGCYDSILLYGFNEHGASGRMKYREMCHKFNLSQLTTRKTRYDSILEVCSCVGRLCNGGSITISGSRHLAPSVPTLLLYCAFVALMFRRTGMTCLCAAVWALAVFTLCLVCDVRILR